MQIDLVTYPDWLRIKGKPTEQTSALCVSLIGPVAELRNVKWYLSFMSFLLGFKSGAKGRGDNLTYQNGAGHQVLPAPLRPYLLQGPPG